MKVNITLFVNLLKQSIKLSVQLTLQRLMSGSVRAIFETQLAVCKLVILYVN